MCIIARKGVGAQRTSGIPVMSGAQFRQLKVIINIYRFLPFLSVFCWNIFTSREVGEADSKDGESIY